MWIIDAVLLFTFESVYESDMKIKYNKKFINVYNEFAKMYEVKLSLGYIKWSY